MRIKILQPAIVRNLLLVILPGLLSLNSNSQHLQISTIEMGGLIAQWDYANNTHTLESFDLVYDDTLLFYTQTFAKSKCIALKQKLFQNHPGFKQKITSEIIYTPYTSGVIKCDFIKAVYRRSKWTEFPSYLLVSYQNNEYKIVGESDNATDKTLNFALNIGERMEIGKTYANTNPPIVKKAIEDLKETTGVPEKKVPVTNPANGKNVNNKIDQNPFGVSMNSIYIVAVCLVAGVSALFISFHFFKKRKSPIPLSNVTNNEIKEANEASIDLQSAFKNFIVTLFDPFYFRWRRVNEDIGQTSPLPKRINPEHLRFEFIQSGNKIKFEALTCFFSKEDDDVMPDLLKESIENYRLNKMMDIYILLGTGGKADDPDKIFLIPLNEIEPEELSAGGLERFRKWGMFFYVVDKNRLV